MAKVAAQSHRAIFQSLPLRLRTFFHKYPPGSVADPTSKSSIFTATDGELSRPLAAEPLIDSETAKQDSDPLPSRLNPFQPHKNPGTGRWHPPIYSLRRQADIVKLAAAHGVEELLPFTVKKTDERARRRIENGLRVKGTGIGQKVKGHHQERTLEGRLDARRTAMLRMPFMVDRWKRGYNPRIVKDIPKQKKLKPRRPWLGKKDAS